MSGPINCVLSDYAGVISHPQNTILIQEMAKLCQEDLEDFEEAYWKHRGPYDKGELKGHAYWQKCFPQLEENIIPSLIEMDCRSWSEINHQTLQWLEELQQSGFKLALFSNMPLELTQYLKRNIPGLRMFGPAIFSCELGLTKPSLESFQKTLQILGKEPNEVIFIDDRKENIQGAKAAGMFGIHFQSVEEAKNELSARVSGHL